MHTAQRPTLKISTSKKLQMPLVVPAATLQVWLLAMPLRMPVVVPAVTLQMAVHII